MKTTFPKASNVFALVIAWIGCSATAAEIAQWPIPNRDVTTLGFHPQKEMLPEMAAHHLELTAKLLKAIADDDYAAFVFRGTASFQKADRSQFVALTGKWRDNLKLGYHVSPIGELRRKYATSLWRVQLTLEGEDEALVLLSTDKRGNIVTFHLL